MRLTAEELPDYVGWKRSIRRELVRQGYGILEAADIVRSTHHDLEGWYAEPDVDAKDAAEWLADEWEAED